MIVNEWAIEQKMKYKYGHMFMEKNNSKLTCETINCELIVTSLE